MIFKHIVQIAEVQPYITILYWQPQVCKNIKSLQICGLWTGYALRHNLPTVGKPMTISLCICITAKKLHVYTTVS